MIDFLQADSAEELKVQIDSRYPSAQIISIYAVGNKHFAWFKIQKDSNKKGNK